MEQKKILKNYILYFLLGLLICLVGMTNVFADTLVDTSQFFTVTGRKWSGGSLEFSSNPAFNNDWLLNAYNVTGGIYTPPNSYDYIEFSYFEHNTSQFNPCNSSGKFTAEFNLLFTSATFNQYVSSVKWGNDSCSIQERNQDGTMKISCVASPSSNNYTDIFVYYNDIQGTATSSLYISRNIAITCGLNTDAIINNDNANTQNIINNNQQNTQDIINNQNQNTQDMIDSQKVCINEIPKLVKIIPDSYINTSAKITSSTSGLKTFIYDLSGMNSSQFSFQGLLNISTIVRYGYSNELLNINDSVSNLHTDNSYSSGTKLNYVTTKKYLYIYVNQSQATEDNILFNENLVCKNGNQALNDSVKDLDSTLNDSDIDNSDAVDFFSNFEDNTHGLSGIISAPLTAINAMLDNQCTPQTATWKGKTVSLECGYDFWNRLSTFKQFLNIALDGLICYRILIKLFKLIENIKNPDNDRVEVMDL